MLTLVINPGGQRRIVTIAEALYHLGLDIHRPGQSLERTPEEKRWHAQRRTRECRRRKQAQERGPDS